jgi:Holliday junction resolvasome RuvABC endonuclease subunit
VIILGIDCGLSKPGAAIVELGHLAGGGPLGQVRLGECLVTSATSKKERQKAHAYKSEDDARRMDEISDWLGRLVSVWRPDVAVVELPSAGGQSAGAIRGMAIGSAIAVVTLRCHGVPRHYITPGANKLASGGNRLAEKQQVWDAVRAAWPEWDGWPRLKLKSKAHLHDEEQCCAIADALSCVLAHLR